jgi:hypothetical protein
MSARPGTVSHNGWRSRFFCQGTFGKHQVLAFAWTGIYCFNTISGYMQSVIAADNNFLPGQGMRCKNRLLAISDFVV